MAIHFFFLITKGNIYILPLNGKFYNLFFFLSVFSQAKFMENQNVCIILLELPTTIRKKINQLRQPLTKTEYKQECFKTPFT